MQGIILMVFIVHFSFYIMLPVQRANLYFALAALFFVIGSMAHNYFYYGAPPEQNFFSAVLTSIFYAGHQIFLFVSIHSYLKLRTRVAFWILVVVEFVGVVLGATWYRIGVEFFMAWIPLFCYLLIILISAIAQRRQVKEAWILTIGFSIASIS